MAKAKRKTGRGKGGDGTLETILRFEIVVVLFSLIGLYYFLSFSPIRMPAEPIASSPQVIAPLPPQPELKVESGDEVETPADGSAAATAAVVLAQASEPLELSASVTDKEAETVPEKPGSVSGSDDSLSSEKTDSDGSEMPQPVTASLEKVPAAAPAVESNKCQAPVAAVSAPATEPAAVPVAAQPESRPQTAPAPPLPPRTIVAGEYVLQVDVLQSKEKLEALSFKVKTETVRRPTPMYRIYLGTFSQRKKAREMMDVVRKKGDEPFLQACRKGYNVVIASFYLQSSVVAWENMYHAAGFEPKVQKVTLEIPHTLLLLDGPAVQQDPDAVLAKLKAAGFTDPHLK